MDKILNTIYNAIDDKKGGNTRILDISAITTISDYFIITSGNNYNQVRAIADNVEEELLKKHGMRPERVEGYNNGEWILLDYIDYVIHVFDREQRLFYDIERIWSDGKEIEVK
ncbi:ribosome silencing factor [Eshraghiella crossota]|uniref:ribosome silencing factor n=1 Tax=Eshraghiella crossota TaxID=45851 RepID=UPI000E97DD83|nr:ribosome silencing factor [Butyrivibrio crossotus]MBS6452458.1 ribosome silencing factor [Butyrivibrio sp.]HAX06627.1 ribosome silencing factor [Butyrivibrio sp.]